MFRERLVHFSFDATCPVLDEWNSVADSRCKLQRRSLVAPAANFGTELEKLNARNLLRSLGFPKLRLGP